MPESYNTKSTVSGAISAEIDYALGFAKQFFDNIGVDLTITSLADSQHKVGSLHYKGQAVDLRIRDLNEQQKDQLESYLSSNLSSQGYDVLLENRNTSNEHLHIEYDPKTGRSMTGYKPRQAPLPGVRQREQKQEQKQVDPKQKDPVQLQAYSLPPQMKKIIILGVGIVLFLVAFQKLK